MQATFQCGPYDGIGLDHNGINLYTCFVPVGIRKFILIPPPNEWDAVRRGEKEKDGQFEDACPNYELLRTIQGMKERLDVDGGIFAEASKESSEGRQVVPNIEFTRQCFQCYRRDIGDVVFPAKRFVGTDEKEREWVCFPVSKEEGESGGFNEMRPRRGRKSSPQPLRLVILHCDRKSELEFKVPVQIN